MFIVVPEPIQLIDLPTGKVADVPPVTFRAFVLGHVLDHPMWSASLEAARHAADLVASFKQAAGGGKMPKTAAPVLELSGALYDKLREAVSTPQYRVNTAMGPQVGKGYAKLSGAGAAQLLPFVDAILHAASINDPRLAPQKEEGNVS